MELNITKFFNEACPKDYSASVAEIGNNAGADTWRAACDDSEEYLLLDNDEKREAFRQFIDGYGAWNGQEIAAMTDTDLNALLLQFISGDIREFIGDKWDWSEYEKQCSEGNASSRLGIGTDNEVYYYIGS